jgi:hypothetical protein
MAPIVKTIFTMEDSSQQYLNIQQREPIGATSRLLNHTSVTLATASATSGVVVEALPGALSDLSGRASES